MNPQPLNALIREARARLQSKLDQGLERDLGMSAFCHAYRVVSFNLGRGAGHTQYVLGDFEPDEDLAIVHPGTVDANPELRKMAGICTSLQQAQKRIIGRDIRDIWIDEPRGTFKSPRDFEAFDEILARWRTSSKFSNGLVLVFGRQWF